jgi:hypothetical protein
MQSRKVHYEQGFDHFLLHGLATDRCGRKSLSLDLKKCNENAKERYAIESRVDRSALVASFLVSPPVKAQGSGMPNDPACEPMTL